MNRLQKWLDLWWRNGEMPPDYLRPLQKHGCLEVPLSADPRNWLAGLSCSALNGRSAALLPPDLPIALKMDFLRALDKFEPHGEELEWLILTGGTTSHGRWVRHSSTSLCASVDSYWKFYDSTQTRLSLIALPVYHVGGMMGWLRAVAAGIPALFCDYKDWLEGNFPDEDPQATVLSLVPTQLERLLAVPEAAAWLSRVGRIHLGGARARPALMQRAREAGLRIALGYGMTESAAMVCALPFEEFLQGASSSGKAMPGVDLRIVGEEGRIAIKTPSLCLGYWPDGPLKLEDGWFLTDDVGRLENDRLTVLGRLDRQINSGGEKIYPEAVESVLLDLDSVRDVIIWSEEDENWGQQLIACVEFKQGQKESVEFLRRYLKGQLAGPAIPRKWLFGQDLPRKLNGKPDWDALKSWGQELQ